MGRLVFLEFHRLTMQLLSFD